MSKGDGKNILSDEERDKVTIVSISVILFLVCIVTAVSILPQYCSLFSRNIESGFACDSLTIGKPFDCPVCENKRVAVVASIIAGLGIGLLFLPFLVFAIRNLRNRPVNQTKLFD